MAKTKNEHVLEGLVKEVTEQQQLTLAPPIFELYVALLSMTLAILMFLFPADVMSNAGLLQEITQLFPQYIWANIFLAAGLIGTAGMLLNKNYLRVVSLIIVAGCYGTLTYMSFDGSPSFGAVLVSWITVFTLISIPLVKFTGIRIRRSRK